MLYCWDKRFPSRVLTLSLVFFSVFVGQGGRLRADVPPKVLQSRAQAIVKSHLGISGEEALRICRFIEKQRQLSPGWGSRTFSSRKTHFSCDVERNKQLRAYLIRVEEENHIGSGCHKSVNKTILYGSRPRVIAECDCDKTAIGEIRALEQLRGCHGIVPFLGSSERSKNKRYSIFLEYYSCGSLSHMLRNKYVFTIPQAIKIAKDLSNGLRCMHAKKLVHRDLHWGNVLLRPSSKTGLYDAVLVDFGKTANYHKIRDEIPQGAKSRHPPEALLIPFKKLDRFLVDVYALGCTLYHIVWGKSHPWAYEYNAYEVKYYSRKERQRRYDKILKMYQETRRECLSCIEKKRAVGQSVTSDDQFKILIFEMMHYKPQYRPTLQTVIDRLNKLAPEL